MSFITKRERVFVEYGQVEELPLRQEGKLKAYASCTDARAWSHFHSDKTEHLVDLIKKDNGKCSNKYVPTKAIVDTLLVVKNNEIKRLKRKIEELENLMGVYDRLELTREQKYELENAHAAIKAAYKDLSNLTLNFDLNLDISNFTDGPDSDYFETGQSRGDEESGDSPRLMSARRSHGDDWSTTKESIGIQSELACSIEASTFCVDPRIDELRENIIIKDAKIIAMKNSLAVMENDVCEPYCIYAHIYTALEKIFGTLCQNPKYRTYLDLLVSGRETRSMDIKGRILFKLKILENFSQALIAPCSDAPSNSITKDFGVMHVETTLSISPPRTPNPVLDSRIDQLVADIMEHKETKDIIKSNENEDLENFIDTEDILVDDNSIDTENRNRLKNLQVDYEELLNCYETVKCERDDMRLKYKKYEELEKELQALQDQLREYNSLWNEKEHFRRRSEDVDILKEQYFLLSEETSNLETRLKAEIEINQRKSEIIEELRNENINLEKNLNDLTIAFEKEKNALQCRLKEKECTVMCQDQQIKSLSIQIDRILENDQDVVNDKSMSQDITIMDEIESLRDQIKNLKDALVGNEEEKQLLQNQFEEKLKLISELRLELEDKRSALEKTLQRNDYLEKYTINFRDEVQRLVEENKKLSLEVDEKSVAVGNLISVINNKSQEVNKLIDEVENKRKENEILFKQLQETREIYSGGIREIEIEKEKALSSLQLARQESQELLNKVKQYENYDDLKDIFMNTMEENKRLQISLATRENDNIFLNQELQKLQEINNNAFENIKQLQEEKLHYIMSLELTKKESEMMEQKVTQFDVLREQLHQLKESQEKLVVEKSRLEGELRKKANELDDAVNSIHTSRKESEELLEKIQNSENLKEDFIQLSKDYQKLVNEKHFLQKEVVNRNEDLNNLLQALNKSKHENDQLLQKSREVDGLVGELSNLKKAYEVLLTDRNNLHCDLDHKTQEINNLYNNLENKKEENRKLSNIIRTLEDHQIEARNSLVDLEKKNSATEKALELVRKESEEQSHKLQHYENLSNEYNTLKNTHDLLTEDNEMLQRDLEKQLQKLKKMEEENKELNVQSQNLIALNNHLEKALGTARNELLITSQLGSPAANITKEISQMKNEKIAHQKKIQELFDKLDESENTISHMTEELMDRDDTIASLQNHINALQDEVTMLHTSLAQAIDTGEQIKDNSYQKIEQSLNKMEAHHSKATHNMKIELAKLQNTKATLEDKLTATMKKSEESFKDKNKYVAQVINLLRERESIVSEIKQLEIAASGKSLLILDKCSLEEVTNSLDNIRQSLDDSISKSSTFKKTLSQVQTASQLLLSKADEAKKIVESEKQKIINEKEEAVAEKMHLEKQLLDLKLKLEQQSLNDEKIIKDLEAEILNHELLIDNINKNTSSYTKKLEEEMNSLQELYQSSLTKIRDLKDKNKKLSEDNMRNLDIIEKIKTQFKEKSNEVAVLQKHLEQLRNKPQNDMGIQVEKYYNNVNEAVQTDNLDSGQSVPEIDEKDKNAEHIQDSLTMNKNILHKKQAPGKLKEHKPCPINEVQILTANVEPTFDFVRNCYLNYKIKRLSLGKLENYSLSLEELNSDSVVVEEFMNTNNFTSSTEHEDDKIFVDKSVPDKNPLHVYDIYNFGQLPRPDSSKGTINTDLTGVLQNYDPKLVVSPGSEEMPEEKSLFLIYQESGNSGANTDHYITNRRKKSNHERSQDSPRQDSSDLKTKSESPLRRALSPTNSLNSKSEEETKYSDARESLYPTMKGRLKKKKSKTSKKSDGTTYKHTQLEYSVIGSNKNSFHMHSESPESNNGHDTHLKTINVSAVEVYDTNTHSIMQKENYQQNASDFSTASSSENLALDEIYTANLADKTLWFHGKSLTTNEKLPEPKSMLDQSVMATIDGSDYFEEKIHKLTKALENVEKDYKHKIEVIKVQYDNNIKHIINEHNQGVKNIQDLHEETLHDVIKVHENETENLRGMSMEALRKAEKLEKENMMLKNQLFADSGDVKSSLLESRKRKSKCGDERKVLTLTSVEAFNVKPKQRNHGPCTCCVDVNVSDTIRNIFEQVDVEQRKMAERAYLKYIVSKINDGNIEFLDAQELSFLHLKVCRTWKSKLSKEEILQKKIDNLETELMHKQRNARQHIAELDRKVAEEKRRLQEVRDAVLCRGTHLGVGEHPEGDRRCREQPPPSAFIETTPTVPEREATCKCETSLELNERGSAGDLIQGMRGTLKPRRSKNEAHRATLAKLDIDEQRREKKLSDETPTRLRRTHDHFPQRTRKK